MQIDADGGGSTDTSSQRALSSAANPHTRLISELDRYLTQKAAFHEQVRCLCVRFCTVHAHCLDTCECCSHFDMLLSASACPLTCARAFATAAAVYALSCVGLPL